MNSLEMMRARLDVRGGAAQQDRMIKDKRKTLDKVVLYSYQGAQIKKIGSEEIARALINPNVIKQDYDDKVLSIGYEFGLKPGDVFEWINTSTKWLIYLQDLTELAYFKGDIRKCNYEIKWKNAEGEIKSTYAAIRGPVEARISSINASHTNIDVPNHSLSILMPQNIDTLTYFKRYAKFYLQNINESESVCWRVEATDSISMPGILQLNAIEYYRNETVDDVDEGIVDAFVEIPQDPNPQGSLIKGEVFIKPFITYDYEFIGEEVADWSIRSDDDVPVRLVFKDNLASVTWTKTYSGSFSLIYGDNELIITVNSLY